MRKASTAMKADRRRRCKGRAMGPQGVRLSFSSGRIRRKLLVGMAPVVEAAEAWSRAGACSSTRAASEGGEEGDDMAELGSK